MESKFKVGDKVVCVNNKDVADDLEVGKEYTIMYAENHPRPAGSTYPRQVGIFAAHSEWADFRFELVKQLCNGTDAEGNPLHFTQDMLKPFMRVVTNNGGTYIVTVQNEGGWMLEGCGGWVNFCNDLAGLSVLHGYEDYMAKEVYSFPEKHEYLDQSRRGKLLWKAYPPKTSEQLAQEKAVAERKATIEEAEKALKQAQEALDKLKGRV